MSEEEIFQFTGEGEDELVQSLKASLAQDVLEMCNETIQTYDNECMSELNLKDNIIIDATATALVHSLIAYTTRNRITRHEDVMDSVCQVLKKSYVEFKEKRELELN